MTAAPESDGPTSSAPCRRNEHHDYSLQLNRWFLKPIGAWPESRATTTAERLLSRVIQTTCYALIAFTVVPCMLYFYFEEQDDLDTKMNSVGPVSHWIMSGINYTSLLWRGEDIRRCIEHMESDWCTVSRRADRAAMLRHAKFGRSVAGFCAVFMHGGVFSYSVVNSLTPPIVDATGNGTVSAPRRLPCPFYSKLLDTSRDPANEIVLLMQFLSGFVANSITVGACSLAAVFAMHVCGQFAVLYMWLNELIDEGKDERTAERKLANIVEHHLRVLNFVSRFEKIMNQICMVELVGCTLNLCLLGYCSIKEWNARNTKTITTYGLVFVSVSFNIFIFCYIGEIITEQCKKVGEMAYFTNWYRLPHKTALGMVLIISRSSVVIKITAGKLVQLSLITFGDVIKTSAAYLNILRKII
ncbi:PREDICTED: odorant receptor 82a-like [Wasmannia auropunctata]|uniref:odorant receptor 82a-like n=1 Tax=Wasmannia auropunctata TaxID=64793 RepID=UPI0005F0235D|nr:PREDICTED: odorant receptor 82a-like [Wasmannia auropunctata]